MSNYTIAETYKLPSRGKLYSGVSEEVRLRSMTTAEEQKRLGATDYPYRMLCEIIDDCMIDDIGISSYDMCIGDYQFLLHKLRVVTYGDLYKMSIVCPYCSCSSIEEVSLDALPVLEYSEEMNKYLWCSLPKTNHEITLRVQTPRMLDVVQERIKEDRRRGSQIDNTLIYTVSSLIDTIDGKSLDVIKLNEWVSKLPMADVNTIVTYAEKLNSSIGVDTKLVVTCDICGLSYEANLKMTQEFFRPALDI